MTSFIKPLPFDMLYSIRDPGITAFQLRFRKIHAFTWTKAKWIDQPIHPLAPVSLKRYVLRQEAPLWLTCVATRESGHSDRVVRSWIARRTKNALAESLKKRGFAPDGRRLSGWGNTADLFGTAALSVLRVATTLSYVDLIKQTDIAVHQMEKYQLRQDNGFNKGKRPTKGGNSTGNRQRQKQDDPGHTVQVKDPE